MVVVPTGREQNTTQLSSYKYNHKYKHKSKEVFTMSKHTTHKSTYAAKIETLRRKEIRRHKKRLSESASNLNPSDYLAPSQKVSSEIH